MRLNGNTGAKKSAAMFCLLVADFFALLYVRITG
jgi:hypothetical protein